MASPYTNLSPDGWLALAPLLALGSARDWKPEELEALFVAILRLTKAGRKDDAETLRKLWPEKVTAVYVNRSK